MPFISLEDGLPGMRSLQTFRPETAGPLNELANILLRGANSLSPAERELIGTVVSAGNDCVYCQSIHGAVAACHFGGDNDLVEQAKRDPEAAPLPEKMRALLHLAGLVRLGGKHVTGETVERARAAGATDLEIHDTVLIAAAFCMFNRYVDGLGTWAPEDPGFYRERGEYLARAGYAATAKPAGRT
ncbi:MAG: peroxidase-related enzyme [Bryobacterales bacterium]|nr:peroxidase-related enzyme [Bryobacterales bacterium]